MMDSSISVVAGLKLLFDQMVCEVFRWCEWGTKCDQVVSTWYRSCFEIVAQLGLGTWPEGFFFIFIGTGIVSVCDPSCVWQKASFIPQPIMRTILQGRTACAFNFWCGSSASVFPFWRSQPGSVSEIGCRMAVCLNSV